jgi:hypothetical protein
MPRPDGRSQRRAALAALAVAALLPATPARAADVTRVTVEAPLPARIDMSGMRRVLVTRFLVDHDVPEFDLNKELIALLRRELRKRTDLVILEVEAPPLPEQPFAELLSNTGFWRRMAETTGADLIISGRTSFAVSDRSGFVQVDEISPLTGQRVRRTKFVDREGFDLDLNLFFIRGSTGLILYEDHFTATKTEVGRGSDRLTVMYGLFEQFEDDVVGILAPRVKTVQRLLFTE